MATNSTVQLYLILHFKSGSTCVLKFSFPLVAYSLSHVPNTAHNVLLDMTWWLFHMIQRNGNWVRVGFFLTCGICKCSPGFLLPFVLSPLEELLLCSMQSIIWSYYSPWCIFIVRVIFVCKGLLFQAVHIAGERKREKGQRQSFYPLLQPVRMEGSIPV